MEILKTRGVATQGIILDTYIKHGKWGNIYYANYQFKPLPQIESTPFVTQFKELVRTDIFQELHRGQPVPILYDPFDPNISSLNVEDSVHTTNPYRQIQSNLTMWYGFLVAAIMTILLVIIYYIYYGEKTLIKWGKPVLATIVNQKIYYERGGRRIAATYQFVDDHGNKITGIKQGLPCQDKPGDDVRNSVVQPIDNPIVLYNPKNSSKNMLYPSDLVICSNTNGLKD